MCAHELNNFLFIALDSIQNQTYNDYELILVVNGPERESIKAKISEKYTEWLNLRIILSDICHLPGNLQVGLHATVGRYIARMDSDDECYPNRLSIQMRYLQENPEISVLGSGVDVVDACGVRLSNRNVLLEHAKIASRMKISNSMIHPTIIIKRELLISMGGFMGPLYCEDYQLWCTLLRDKSIKFANINTSLLKYRSIGREARHNTAAYKNVFLIQFDNFLNDFDPLWLLGILNSISKCLYYSITNYIRRL